MAPHLKPLLKVKWPNDLLHGVKKLAGILIEGESEPVFAAAVGVGVNCVSHPSATVYPATDLAAAGAHFVPEQLFALLATSMQQRLRQWQRGQGFASVRADWLRRAAGIGEPIRVRLPERELAGRFQGLDEVGRLLVDGPDGVASVTAGEVFGLVSR
jgi:BirA family biotin operon repressor/biotin-[acetyl-CoA-carboxylase] ligase